jgi:hypothetical protein
MLKAWHILKGIGTPLLLHTAVVAAAALLRLLLLQLCCCAVPEKQCLSTYLDLGGCSAAVGGVACTWQHLVCIYLQEHAQAMA